MEWPGPVLGAALGVVAVVRWHLVVIAALGAVSLVGFVISLSYVLSHYDECGSCSETTGAHLASGVTLFSPVLIVLGRRAGASS
jgi:hypothetical protein